ncbi:uncharacterized protein LOC123664445 [Melitaea cinxia]|uniref:uncharacterized protein LOC123664445 n=1 Tax=Melitaea cinxia TaxID=113334 RepID=UPI001E273E81|nr:uncharacterized protein LOC123664445 [Melitaea cinxia]
MGDFNAKIGMPLPDEKLIMKNYGYGIRNIRGERLIEFAYENKLSVINTFFKKKTRNRWTWRSPDGKTKNELDYILSNFPRNFYNIEVLNITFPSDHRPLRATVKIRMPKKSRATFNNNVTIPLKTDAQISTYLTSLHDNLYKLAKDETQLTVQEYHDQIINIIQTSLKKANCDSEKPSIMTNRTRQLISRRHELHNKKPKTRSMKNELKALYKIISKYIKYDYSSFRSRTIEKHLNSTGSLKRAYKELRTHKNWIEGLQNQDKICNSRDAILNIATSFYKDLYNCPTNTQTNNLEKLTNMDYSGGIEPIKEAEILYHIKRMKSEKSPGTDKITNEAIKKAFDTLSHASIWETLLSQNVDITYIKILKHIYEKCQSRVQLESIGPPVKIKRGVRQGDPLSPRIFIGVLEHVISGLDWNQMGLNIKGKYLSHLRFADDIVLMSESSKKLEYMISTLHEASKTVGLEINLNKTKIITNSIVNPIKLNNIHFEYVDSYIYLGKQISFKAQNNDQEITRRIKKTWSKFWSYKEVLKGHFSVNLKRKIMNTCLLPSLTYACQTWKFTSKAKHKIKTTQRAMERSMLKIRKMQKIRHTIIREKSEVIDALNFAMKLKWKWAGHVSRLTDERWTKRVTEWTGPQGYRRVGRPLTRWADDLTHTAGRDWLNIAKDRDTWHSLEEAFT